MSSRQDKNTARRSLLVAVREIQRNRNRALAVLGCMVAIATSLALMVPAITLTTDSALQVGTVLNEQTEASDQEASGEEAAISEDSAANDAAAAENPLEGEAAVTAGGVDASSEDVAMPAQSFSADLKDVKGNVVLTVAVEAPEGAFPAGTSMKIGGIAADEVRDKVEEAIKDANGEDVRVKNLTAVDIVFLGPDGNEIEPAKSVEVKIVSDDVRKFDNPTLVHVLDKGKESSKGKSDDAEVVKKAKVVEDEDALEFESRAFSPYVIVEYETISAGVITADGSTYTVTVSYGADAGVPEGASLRVEELPEASRAWTGYVDRLAEEIGAEPAFARLFDITILDGDGNEVQPGTPVEVGISLDNANELTDGVKVAHFNDASGNVDVIDASLSGDTVSFDAESFSIYAIVDSSKRLQYNFYDGTNLLVSEYIKKQDNVLQELYDPGVEPEYGQTFVGWAYTPNEADPSKIYTIEQLNEQAAEKYSSATEELTEIDVYAMYDEAWYLRYMDQDDQGNATVLNVVRVRKDAANKDVTIDYTYTPEEGIVFEGWTDVATTHTYQQGETITLDHHVDLYVKLQGRNWLVFDSNAGGPGSGATYTPLSFLLAVKRELQSRLTPFAEATPLPDGMRQPMERETGGIRKTVV